MKQKIPSTGILLILFSFSAISGQSGLKSMENKSLRPEKHIGFSSGRLSSSDGNTIRFPVPEFKSAPAMPVQKMDSIVDYYYDGGWMIESVESYKYNLQGRMISERDAYYDVELQRTVPDSRIDYGYTADGMVSSLLEYEWEGTAENWVRTYGINYEYNTDGKEISSTGSDWDPVTGMWNPEYLDSSRYDMQGILLYESSYSYDTMLMDWTPYYRTEYSYDTNGFNTGYISYAWNTDSSSWEEVYKTELWPDENGQDTLEWDYYRDGSQWLDDSRSYTSYNANGDIVLEEDYYFDGEVWTGDFRYEYVYDGSNRLAQELEYYWDFSGGDWTPSYDTQYARDENGNITVETYSEYDTASQAFVFTDRTWYDFDDAVLWTDLALPIWFTEEDQQYDFINKVLSSTEADWDTVSMSFDTTYQSLVYYSDFLNTVTSDTSCTADFSWEQDSENHLLVNFTDLSDSAIVSWYWTFGDGETSTLRNPGHLYGKAGTYEVILNTLDESGFCNNTVVKRIKAGDPGCNASYTFMIDTANLTVTFTNASEGVSPDYYWKFGDGTISSEKDPVHQYQRAGTYEITLTMQSQSGTTCNDRYSVPLTVGIVDCDADFAVYVDSSSNTAYFRAKQVAPGNLYNWVFGDGSVANTPSHVQTFSDPGYYSAMLTVSNQEAGCVESNKRDILVGSRSPGGKASFIYLGGDGSTVSFTDQSLGEGLSYLWNFNDGNTSTDKDPVHTYLEPGYYTVCLTVTAPGGKQDTYCEMVFAGTNTQDECLAQFSYTVIDSILQIACQDRSFGNPDSWKWTYNENEWSSTVQNPVYNSGSAGYYKVRLTMRNSANGCTDDAFGLINLASDPGLKAGIGYTIDSSDLKAESYPVDFVGVSLGDAGKLKWSFGDGTYDSTTVNPTHVYTEPGTYTVCLTVTNTTTGEADTTCEEVTVESATSITDYVTENVILRAYPNPFSESCQVIIHLRERTDANLTLYDLGGRKMKVLLDRELPSGEHRLSLDGSDLGEGLYYLILNTNLGTERQSLSIIR